MVLLLLGLLITLSACSTFDDIDTNTPAGKYELASRYEKAERYEEALRRFSEIRKQHPYSRFAVMSELKMADIHFAREKYDEALASYQLFREFHPKHDRIDYVVFRSGLSSFYQLPSTVDRDLSAAKTSIAYFEEVITLYPGSEFTKEARAKKEQVIRMLAEKELYIADYYFNQEEFLSAMKRYDSLIRTYPRSELVPKALLNAGISAYEVQENDKAKSYINKLYTNYPNSKWAKSAEDKVRKYGIR